MDAFLNNPTNLAMQLRIRYHALTGQIHQAILESTGDPIVFERLGDDLDDFDRRTTPHLTLLSADEAEVFRTNLQVLKNDLRTAHGQARDSSHHGRPTIVVRVLSGRRGRPQIHIEPEWLRWAYSHRGVTGIARFLGISRGVVRRALVQSGIASPCADDSPLPPSPPTEATGDSGVTVMDTLSNSHGSWTRPTSTWTDDELDAVVAHLRTRYPASGLKMLGGLLERLGAHVPRERLRQSLFRIDPIRRIFQRTPIQRRAYKVAGPNALWHNDGQHGLIRYSLIIHAFIDGHSRVVTAIRVSNNNRAATVLDIFLEGAAKYGVPSRVRGDHGTENLLLAEWMERARGERRGSYIWGRSVHNVRIERLWVDVTTQWGGKWAAFFHDLEIGHNLTVDNQAHLWLLHCLFLADINTDAELWADGWNRHKMSIRGQASQSPAEMWGFDMVRLGFRGDSLDVHDLEHYGIDWEALGRTSMQSHASEHTYSSPLEPTDGVSWIGRQGPPPNLNTIDVDPPTCPLDPSFITTLNQYIYHTWGAVDKQTLTNRWVSSLAFCQITLPHVF